MKATSIRALVLAVIALTGACQLIVPSKDDLSGGTALADAGGGAPTDAPGDAPSPPQGEGGVDAGGSSLVQQTTGKATNTSSLMLTLPAPPQDGDALVVTIVAFAAATPTITVSGGGVTWVQQTKSTVHVVSSVFAGVRASNGSASVTVTTSAPQQTLIAHLSEWSGVSTFGTAKQSAGSDVPTTAALDVPDGTALVYASAATHTTLFGMPANGFVALETVNAADSQILVAYRLAPARGSYMTTWSEPTPTSNGWDAHIVSFAR